jgi:hypothetical protein
MDSISQEIVYHLADFQYDYDGETGQRWPIMLAPEKQDIPNFRATCRAFRDAYWIPFRNLLVERIFYLNEDDLEVLQEISDHPRLLHLINTLTLGSQVSTSHGLHILERGLETHPLHAAETGASSPAWQRGLSSRCKFSYTELVRLRELYGKSYADRKHSGQPCVLFQFSATASTGSLVRAFVLSGCVHGLVISRIKLERLMANSLSRVVHEPIISCLMDP